MTRSRITVFLAGAVAVVLVVLGTAEAAAKPHASKAHSRPAVEVRSTTLGKILVDSRGRTLYMFEKDKGSKSSCFGSCAANWPPLRTSSRKPAVGKGVSSSKVGTTKRSDGKRQVTYKGHPLYLFVGDKKAGDTNGQNLEAFGAKWHALSPAGNKVEPKSPSSGGGTNPGGSGGY
jgi:predicted lipoprotein with Yx(FWY)xxD motif